MDSVIELFSLSSLWLVISTGAYADSGVTIYMLESVTGYEEQKVILPCQLTTSLTDLVVVDVTWKKSGATLNLAVYSPAHGTHYPAEPNSSRISFKHPTVNDATLVITNASRNDTGIYVCRWSTFPKGTISRETALEILDIMPRTNRQLIILAVIFIVLLLGLMLLTEIFVKRKKERVEAAERDASGLEMDECHRELVYASLNLDGQKATRNGPSEENIDSEAVVYGVVKHQLRSFFFFVCKLQRGVEAFVRASGISAASEASIVPVSMDNKDCFFHFKMTLVIWISSACIALLSVTCGKNVTVDESLSALVGTEVLLPCQVVNNSTIVQISWTKANQNKSLAVYSPQYGISYSNKLYSGRIAFRNHSRKDGSILINASELQDEGNYSCQLTLFPVGIQSKAISLTILAIPSNNATPIPTEAGVSEVPVATCTSANGKPAASIMWISNLPGNQTSNQTKNEDGTLTVTSQYKIAPNSSNNGQTVMCVISHLATNSTDTFTVELSILYRPEVTITGYDGKWSERDITLNCVAKANPPATNYSWQGLPEGLQSEHADLLIEKVNSLMNGTWACEATNIIGTGRAEVVIRLQEKGANSADAPGGLNTLHIVIIAAVILCVVVIALILMLMKRERRMKETSVHLDDFSSQTQVEQRTVYASLNLNRLLNASAQREHFHDEERTVYADIKYNQS
ncbi:nectin-2-like [Heptranchias perlo]|uniref:nectin-2-like n=1 Tax=Heptranchias perlo TaxID=212740 RepID=UPI0035594FD6